ncbi:MAG: hypothetical protein JKX81_03050 [Arenicella sp.]|nr:hypothetical protein [Arenicella sp.]
MSKIQTFFHVGYARAASTFLQKTVFPALTGLQYIPRNNFRVRESEKSRFKSDKILMSREAGEYIYDRCDRVHQVFDSKIIISVRRHDVLAASTYRLYVKNGHTFRHDKFLDVVNNSGVRKVEDFTYMRLVNYVEKQTGCKPLLLIFEDYINDPEFYLDSLCAYLQCSIDKAKLSHRAVHKSYTDKQLRLRRQFSDKHLSQEKNKAELDKANVEDYTRLKNFKGKVLVRVSGIFMRLARFAPDSWLDDEPPLIESHSKAIRDYFADDWAQCYDYVEQQSLELGVKRNMSVSV